MLENLRIFQHCLFTGEGVAARLYHSTKRARPLRRYRASSPKGGALGKTRNFTVLPRPLPLGEVASRSDDGEGEPVPGMAGKPAGFD